MSFNFVRLELHGVILIKPQALEDHRGFFLETYKHSEFAANGIPEQFVQDNYSHSLKGVLRGLHYQKPPKAQGKLVMATKGELFDVAVDIRQGSPTYGKWIGIVLSSQNHFMLYVPVGFAHGFCVLSDEADVLYKATVEYAPECDGGIIWNDPDLAISWPVGAPILSPKDARLPTLKGAGNDFRYN